MSSNHFIVEGHTRMEMAELVEIEEEELLAFIRSIPNLWEQDRKTFSPDLMMLLERLGDTDEILFGVCLFATGANQVSVFLEYQRDTSSAVFEIHCFGLDAWGNVDRVTYPEKKIRDIIRRSSDGNFSSFVAIPPSGVFICPNCEAQYALKALKMTEAGHVKCQNCGKWIDFSKYVED